MNRWNPSIEVESARGIREVSLRTHHLMNRKIFLSGGIDGPLAEQFLEQMMYLEEKEEPVTLIVNSPGGEVNAGLLIYDILQSATIPVDICCAGMASSMAAIILASGQKGHRFILPHSRVMIHEPLIAGGVGGSATSIRNISESILETREITNGILAKHTGKTLEEINKATAYDNYMNAEQAVAFGICDRIVTHI
ncbi:MAG: ATP-dependent Clp protease proteolytic subunit [Lachnospiraceae bacterium]|nr:ATP-dependent Clp protease proteolytic subunit [Lachnospiraceae bacterium]